MSDTLSQIFVAVVTAGLTAPLTVWLSLRRFYAEKWWEQKLAVYKAIIELLHRLAYPFNEITDEIDGSVDELSADRKAELLKRHAETFVALRR